MEGVRDAKLDGDKVGDGDGILLANGGSVGLQEGFRDGQTDGSLSG